MKRNSLNIKNLKPFVIMIIGIFHGRVLFAQATKPAVDAASKSIEIPEFFFSPSFYIISITIIILLATVLTLLYAVRKLTEKLVEPEGVKENVVEINIASKPKSFWSGKFMRSITAAVPIEQEQDMLLDHNYDGIQELDNKLPPWWVWGFYATIVFAVIYLAQYHVFKTGKLQVAEYKQEMQEAADQKAELMKVAANYITIENVKQLTDATSLTDGKDIFKKNCVACHKEDGGGNVGPNLTDEFWIHGGGIRNIFNTISEGVPSKGMITWKNQFSPKQIQAVASYVMSLHGTNPPVAKDPQGEKWVEPTTYKADTTSAVKDTISIKKK